MNLEEELKGLKWQTERNSRVCDHLLDGTERRSSSDENNDEVKLREIVSVIWQSKSKIAITTIIFALMSVILSLQLPNLYLSEAKLLPNSQQRSSSALSSIAGQFGGLASLAGIQLGAGELDKTGYALQLLKSREFIFEFINENNLKPHLFAVEKWDNEAQELIYDDGIYRVDNGTWVLKDNKTDSGEPSDLDAYDKFLKKHLAVAQDNDSGVVTISVKHYSPVLAKKLVDLLIDNLNETVKEQDMREAERSINFLELELENTDNVGTQSMFYQLIEQQYQTLMLTKVRNDYVLKTIDKAVVPEKKVAPKRALICMLGTILGFILITVFVLVQHFEFKNKSK